MNWYLAALKKYTDFSGRARRKEYWFFTLFNLLAYLVATIVDGLLGSYSLELGIGLVSAVYTLAVLLPSFAVAIRRLHDTNRTGWWFLLVLVPLIGPLILIVFFVMDGDEGENPYGRDPKLEEA